MRIVIHILLVVATVAILLLPFYLLVRHFSRKYVKQEIGNSPKYATITLTDNEVIVRNETSLVRLTAAWQPLKVGVPAAK